MSVYMQLIGWHDLAVPPSLRLFIEGESSLFNCGENIQRFFYEHKLHLVKIKNIFFTRVDLETVGGLIGLMLTLDNISNNELNIYGPKPLGQLIRSFSSSFAKIKNLKIQIHELDANSEPIVLKNKVTIRPIILFQKEEEEEEVEEKLENGKVNEINEVSQPMKKRKIENNNESCFLKNVKQRSWKHKTVNTICYHVESPKTLGKFYPEKAKKLNVPPGKSFGLLKSGISITIKGKVIKPEDVCDATIDGRKCIIIDIQHINQLQLLNHKINENKELYLKNIEYIFHVSKEHIMQNEKYKKLFFTCTHVKHIKCNQTSNRLHVCPFVSSASLNSFLSNLIPNIFWKYQPEQVEHALNDLLYKKDKGMNGTTSKKNAKEETEETDRNNIDTFVMINNTDTYKNQENQQTNGKHYDEIQNQFLIYKPLTKFILYPFHKIEIDASESLTELHSDMLNSVKTKKVLEENKELVKEFNTLNKTMHSKNTEEPSFYFLGTGCSMPSTFRNVSGIILKIEKDFSIVLDFGEGSIYQLFWMSTSWDHFISLIQSIKIIFISHAHADHHVGLYYLLHLRKRWFPYLKEPLLIIPITLKKWIYLCNDLFLQSSLPIIYNSECLEINHEIKDQKDNILNLTIFKVNHINESYGIKIKHSNLGSIVYSADTRPCYNVKIFSKNCDILIHEATFDDELQNEAIQKNHSTTKEAIDVSIEANCKVLILTHFSQRYPKMPKLNNHSGNDSNELINKIIYSFDYMYIPLKIINMLPQYFNKLLNLLEKIF